jgi:Leucine-rich repeat (LRR) protein
VRNNLLRNLPKSVANHRNLEVLLLQGNQIQVLPLELGTKNRLGKKSLEAMLKSHLAANDFVAAFCSVTESNVKSNNVRDTSQFGKLFTHFILSILCEFFLEMAESEFVM